MRDMPDHTDLGRQAAELGIDPKQLASLLLFRRLTAVILDPAVPDDQVRQRVFEQIPQPELRRALDAIQDGRLDDDDVEDGSDVQPRPIP